MTDVLVLATYLTRRQAGAAHATINIINGLARSGWARVRVLAFEVEPGVLDEGVPVTIVTLPPPPRGLWRVGLLFDYRSARRVLRQTLPAPAGFCYTQSPLLGPAYRAVFPDAPLASHTGAVLWDRELLEEGVGGFWGRLQARAARRLESDSYASARWTHLVSTDLVARERARAFNVPRDRFRVCPLPVDGARFDPDRPLPDVRAALGIAPDAFVVAAAARLVAWKQVDWAVEAVAAMRRPAHLLVVGDGPERARLAADAERRGVADRVHLVGWQDPPAYLRAADVFALPSTIESFGMVYAEAMTMGVPCVGLVSDPPRVLSAAADVIGDAGSCVRTPGELAARLDALAEDAALRRTLAARARARAAEFTVAHYLGALADVAGAGRHPTAAA